MGVKKVYFVRHGETESNQLGLYQSPDEPLSPKGREGALAVAERCLHLKVDAVIASHFTRAQETARFISDRLEKPLITIPNAHEILNAKKVWGKPFTDEEAQKYQEEKEMGFSDPAWHPDGAENYYMVSERIEACIQMLEACEHEHVVFVSHGNFLRFFIARLLLEKDNSIEPNLAIYRSLSRMSNVSITEFDIERDTWKLFTWNDHAHFAE